MIYFQHNKNIIVNKDSFEYVKEYKSQLLSNITQILHEIEIKYIISHGNLLEHTRKKAIQHDDDLDIRMDINDLDKWKTFCENNNNIMNKYNLVFDKRFYDMKKQLHNGIQVRLIEFVNKDNLYKEIEMDIHCDLVFNKVTSKFWIKCGPYDIDYNNLREIKFLNVNTFAPSLKDTHKY